MMHQNFRSSHGSSHHHETCAVGSPIGCTGTIQNCQEEFRHPIHAIVTELGNSSPCSRRIALGKLQCALTSGILRTCDSEQDTKALLRSLLEWFNLPGLSHEILVLSMLSKLAQDDENRKLLVELGAVEFMEQYQADACHTILPYVISLLYILHKQIATDIGGVVRSIHLQDAGMGYVTPMAHFPTQPGRGSQCGQSFVSQSREDFVQTKVPEFSSAHGCYGRDCKSMSYSSNPSVVDRANELNDKDRDFFSKGLCGGTAFAEMSKCHAKGSGEESRAGSCARSPVSATCEHLSRLPFNGVPPIGDPQNARAPKKADFRLKPPDWHTFSDTAETEAVYPILPCIAMEESDDKYLFNLNVTLQYLDDLEVLGAALKELREAVVFDFHPAALLQKYSIVQRHCSAWIPPKPSSQKAQYLGYNVFVLLQKMNDSNLEQIVFDFLLELVQRIKAALRFSQEAGFQVHLDAVLPPQGIGEAGYPIQVNSKLDLKYSYPVKLKVRAQNALDYGKVVHLLGETPERRSNQPVISIGRTLHALTLQLVFLLVNERHRDRTFRVLYDLLPLLRPPSGTKLEGKVQLYFAQYFRALCEVLQTLDGNSRDMESLCMDTTTKRNFDKTARQCAPSLKVLVFSAELLCLLQPSHVAGLLPPALVKALVTLAGDLILSECTLGVHKMIFPHLKVLDPNFFRSYKCASEASFTLHILVKELASSEETVALWKANQSNSLAKINVELLFKYMIQAIPNYAYFNYTYLVPRMVHITLDILRIELVNTCLRGAINHRTDEGGFDISSSPSRIISVEDVTSQARLYLRLLLSHASASIRQVAYDSLLEVSWKERQAQPNNISKLKSEWEDSCTIGDTMVCIDRDNPEILLHRSNGILRPLSVLHRLLIFGTSIMGEIITVGLHGTATCKQSAALLEHLFDELSEAESVRITPAYLWIACCTHLSPSLVPTVERIKFALFSTDFLAQKVSSPQKRGRWRPEWTQVSSILRSLFSSRTPDRFKASLELLAILGQYLSEDSVHWWLRKVNWSEVRATGSPKRLFEDPFQFLRDPFQQCLKFKEATLFSLAFGSSTQGARGHELSGISARGRKKVEDLVGIFKSTSVGEAVRKAAVERLTWIIQDPSLRSLLEHDKELFHGLLEEIVVWTKKSDTDFEESRDKASSRCGLQSIEDMDGSDTSPSVLGAASLSLLARLLTPTSACEGSLSMRDMLLNNSCKAMWLLIPIVFHPFKCVRKDMALLLAFTLFSSDLLVKELREVIIHRDPLYQLPGEGDVPTASVHSAEQDIRIAVPHPFIGGHLFPCQVMAVDVRPPVTSSADGIVDEQLVHRIIPQSVLLQGGIDNLLNSLESRVLSPGNPVRIIELQATACLPVLHADITMRKLLKSLADPQVCCGLELQYLEELEAQCLRQPQAAKLLARASWVPTFQRFLTNPPSTPVEAAQLLKVLQLVHFIINSESATSSGFLFLALVFKQVLLPLLAKSPSPRLGPNLHHAIVLIEGDPAVNMDYTILKVLVGILLGSKEQKDASLFGQTAIALTKGTSLLSVLFSNFVKGPSAPYICCVLAVQCVSLIAKGIAAEVGLKVQLHAASRKTAWLQQDSDASSEHQFEGHKRCENETEVKHRELETFEDQEGFWTTSGGQVVAVVLPLIKHMAHLHSNHYRSLRHKRLVREIVSCLWSITSCVPPHLWEDLWSSTASTHWMSRLLDDQEATIRAMGFGILAGLVSPATPKTRALVEQNWADIGNIVVHTILNKDECYAVREEALRFLISVTNWRTPGRQSAMSERRSTPACFEGNDGLGVNAALRRCKFWMLFSTMLQENNGTPGFFRVLLELTRKLTKSDAGFITSILCVNPHILQALIEHLEFGTNGEDGHAQICLHSPDIFSTKACVGEIVIILIQQENAHIQALLQTEVVLQKLLRALSYCLNCLSFTNSPGNDKVESGHKEVNLLADRRQRQNLHGVMEFEELQAISYVSEALNLVVCQHLQTGAPQSSGAINHIRVDDIMCFNSRDGFAKGSQLSRVAIEARLGRIIGSSRVCCGIARFLSRRPLVGDMESSKTNNVRGTLSGTLKRTQLAVSALMASLLSQQSLAKAVLENDGASCDDSTTAGGEHEELCSLVPLLYDTCELVIKNVHELGMGRKPEVDCDGEFLIYLRRTLSIIGTVVQNLLAFSSNAKTSAVESNLPSRLLGYAYESYGLLASCGLAPMRNIPTTPAMISMGTRRKRCNRVSRVVSHHPVRQFISSRNARHAKLSDHHRRLLLCEIITCIRLLKNFYFENPDGAETFGGEGVLNFVRLVWGFALSEVSLLHECLGLLCNLAAQSDDAKEFMASQPQLYDGGQGTGSFMDCAATIVLRLPSDQLSYTLSVGLLQILVTMTKARANFLKKQYLPEFLHHFGLSVRNNDVLRQQLILQLLINLSIYANGQRMLSKGLSNGYMLDLVLDTVEQSHYVPASSSALFLLRNLAFCRETRYFFLCNDRTLPLLIKSLGSSSLEARANAASALWILTSTERRILSMIKKVDACPSLVAAHEASKLHLKIVQSHVRNARTEQNGTQRDANFIGVFKEETLVKHIEQSLFAVIQVIGGMHSE